MGGMRSRSESGAGGLLEIAAVFARLGCLSFGGPVAHLGYFRAELVERRRWVDEVQYAELVALCQFLPGPASSQVVFGLGLLRGGIWGALVASVCFTVPSALLMLGFAYGVASAEALRAAGWLHGLGVAAVAVVAQAVWALGRKLCVDRARLSLCVATAAALLAAPGAATQLGALAFGAAVGWHLYRHDALPTLAAPAGDGRGRGWALAALLAFVALLVALPLLAVATGSRAVAEVAGFYRAGSLVFGGGHVVLPLLRAELVPPGWLTDEQFLAGYGAAQALPGPLFTLSAYLGAAMHPGPSAWLDGLRALLFIFLPAWLLVSGALPFWQRWRTARGAQAALAGANAAVVGVLLAALYRPVVVESVRSPADLACALLAFAALEQWRARPWAVVACCAAAGQWLLAR